MLAPRAHDAEAALADSARLLPLAAGPPPPPPAASTNDAPARARSSALQSLLTQSTMIQLTDLAEKLAAKLAGWVEALVVMLPNLGLALVLLVTVVLLSNVLRRVVHDVVLRITHNEPISQLLSTLARVLAIMVALFLCLGLLNLDKAVTSLLAGVGVVGLALGFAFQDIAANFMAGFIMAVAQPFDVGDLVQVAGQRGKIKTIALRASEIETLDGLSILVPNKDIFQSPIVNYTHTPQRRLDLSMGTAYGDDMRRVRDVVLQAVDGVPERDLERKPELFFESFGDSSINFSVRVWLTRADERSYLHARSEAMIAIKGALDAANLSIPFPIRTLDFGAEAVGGTGLGRTRLAQRLETESSGNV